jgi:hypothetical protein
VAVTWLQPDTHRAQTRRRGAAIHAYNGPNGGGKSLCAVYDTLPSLDAGRPVLSTVQLLVPSTLATLGGDRSHPLCELYTDHRQLLTATGCDVLLDEVTGVASSRESAGLPVQVANRLVQLRRDDVVVRWTAPNYARADLIIREVTQAVTYCTGHLARRVDGRLWSQRRLFLWRTYDAREYDAFTANQRERIRPIARQWFWRPGAACEDAYDTLAQVSMVGVANQAGLCIVCGGKRTHPRCACPTLSADEISDPAAAGGAAGSPRERRSRARGAEPPAPGFVDIADLFVR